MMHLLVGLGNPGASYARNRHNIGFMAIDTIAQIYGLSPWKKKFQGEMADGQIADQRVILLKPQNYMNRSGQSVRAALDFYKLEPAQVTVFHDDLALPHGRIRVKKGGGAGGHNGLRDIDRHCGVDYWRVRMGIGHPGDKNRVHGYVLQDFAKSEEECLIDMLAACGEEVGHLLADKPDAFASRVALHLGKWNPKPKKKGSAEKEDQPDGL